MSKRINPFNGEHYPDPTAHAALSNILRERRQTQPVTKHVDTVRRMVFVCSPLAGDVKSNLRMARKYARFTFLNGCAPIVPHLLFPQFLDDERPAERSAGIEMGLMLLAQCKELWAFGGKVSNGMRSEIAFANRHRIPVRYFNERCKEVERYE